jgi:hypothetical protein
MYSYSGRVRPFAPVIGTQAERRPTDVLYHNSG